MEYIRTRVRKVYDEAAEIKSFELVDLNGQSLPPFTPGAHIDIKVGGVVRQYSLCNGPGDRDHYKIAVKREADSRGGSIAMHETVREGSELSVSVPRNLMPLEQEASRTVMLAGGIGITPLFSMAQHLKAVSKSFELHYFTRSTEQTAFCKSLSGPDYAENVSFHYGIAPDAMPTLLRAVIGGRSGNSHLYLCGPTPFMARAREIAAAAGWPETAVHFESFSAGLEAQQGRQDGFELRLARTGKTCRVAEGETILSALGNIGIHVDTSCEQGVCGTCLTRVLEGEVDHRDAFLTEVERAANDQILPCVSRAKSPSLTLNL